MSWVRRGSAVVLAACACAALPGVCRASETAKLHVRLTPERPGESTTIVFAFRLSPASAAGDPSPLREIDLRYPGALGFATSELGLESCTATILETQGPKGCPADSRVGYGAAVVEVPFGAQLIREHATIATFMAPLREGQLSLLYYAQGTTPLLAELVFPATLAPGLSDGNLNTDLPLVPTLPEAPDAAVVQLTSTIGPAHILYHRHTGGRTVLYRPRGVILPRRCPRGGFRFAAAFTFADGSHSLAVDRVPCPVRA